MTNETEIYSLYKTICLYNGKVYIGVHKERHWPTKDSYLGSGADFSKALKKYGTINFDREILCVSNNKDYIYDLEKKLVTQEFILEESNYNIKTGGAGSKGKHYNLSPYKEYLRKTSKLKERIIKLKDQVESKAKLVATQKDKIKKHDYKIKTITTELKKITILNRKLSEDVSSYVMSADFQKVENEECGRPICLECRLKPAAVNYIKEGVRHYRTKCDTCISEKPGVRANAPQWRLAGYKKKPHCEQCGFHAVDTRQLTVWYVDGNLKNNKWINLKTICSNCAIEMSIANVKMDPMWIKPNF